MSKVHYMVSMGDGSHGDFTDIREVASALGVDKITKKDILAGKYPQVSIQKNPVAPVFAEDVDSEMDMGSEPVIEDIVGDEIESYELTPQDRAAIDAIDSRMVQYMDDLSPEGVALYDDLNRLKLSIAVGAGTALSDTAYELLMETLQWNASQDAGDTDAGIESIDELAEALEQAGIKDVEPTHNTPVLTNTGNTGKQKLAGQEIEYPEVGSFKDEKYLKRFYKQLDDSQLDEWIGLEGLTYKSCEHESINRMRKCMAILELHFPKKPKTNTKSKSKYSQYSTEELVAMANKHGLPVKDSKGSDQILRMYTIMELRKAGLIS
jgi:hypothetical protein